MKSYGKVPPETDVFISLSNTNLKFRYSAIIFNNFNNNQPVNRKKNYITAEFRYSKKKVVDLEKFLNNAVKPSFEASSYRINASPQNTGYNTTNPIDKNISYLEESHINRIYKAYKNFKDDEGFCKVVTLDEVLNNKASLNMSLYVSNVENKVDQITLMDTIENWEASSIKLKESMNELFQILN